MNACELAALHAVCFDHPRPWTADEFATMAAAAGTFMLTAEDAFLVGRVIAEEAELLTLAVAPRRRRNGKARTLVTEFLNEAKARQAEAAFLEVAADNAPARALYEATGWRTVGRRRAYYGPSRDALVMRQDLVAPDTARSPG